MLPPLTLAPIGVVRSPFADRVSAPRQPPAAAGVQGTIELFPGHDFEHALEDLEGWDYLWVVFWFHLNTTWRPKVLPPRSAKKRRGVFSTRSPHRPNPIGLSLVRLDSVVGRVLHVRDVDIIDGTPVLDLKPYVPYCDSRPRARTGWLEPLANLATDEAPIDPEPGFDVTWGEIARAQTTWLTEAHGVDLVLPATRVLALGPQPHPYRRIKEEHGSLRLAVKDFRLRFCVEGRHVIVLEVTTGYRPRELQESTDPRVEIHREFVRRFGGKST